MFRKEGFNFTNCDKLGHQAPIFLSLVFGVTSRREFEKREQYLLKGAAIDPKFSQAYQELP